MKSSCPKIAVVVLVLALGQVACSLTRYRELETLPLTKGEVWRGVSEVAESGGWPADPAGTDEGLGVFQSRWRLRALAMGDAGRSRLRVELEPRVDPGQGWLVRYYVEMQKVDDPRRAFSPAESDWLGDGQDAQQEEIFAARLRLRLGMDLYSTGQGDGTIR